MNMVTDGLDWLVSELQQTASVVIIYQSTKFGTSDVLAILPPPQFQLLRDDEHTAVEYEYHDFVIAANQFDDVFEPFIDDTIIWTLEGIERHFAVKPPFGNTVWTWSDAYKKIMRVHTLLVKEVPT